MLVSSYYSHSGNDERLLLLVIYNGFGMCPVLIQLLYACNINQSIKGSAAGTPL